MTDHTHETLRAHAGGISGDGIALVGANTIRQYADAWEAEQNESAEVAGEYLDRAEKAEAEVKRLQEQAATDRDFIMQYQQQVKRLQEVVEAWREFWASWCKWDTGDFNTEEQAREDIDIATKKLEALGEKP